MTLEISNLTKTYGSKRVLNRLSATFKEGKTTVLSGPSGVGKTTLLRILLQLEMPDAGEVLLHTDHEMDWKDIRFAVVFQENRLCETFTVMENIQMIDKGINKEKIAEALKAVGLENELDTPVKDLSGGMKRRVAILRAILMDADLYILDEPIKEVDEDTKQKTCAFMKKMLQGKTVIYVTHDEEEAKYFADERIYIEERGITNG